MKTKTWMLALALVAVFGMTGLADAAGKGKGHGIHGKIQSVTSDSITISVHHHGKKKNADSSTASASTTTQPSTLTIKFDGSATITIDGVTGKLDSSAIGKYAVVLGSTNSDASITATQITVTTAKPSHKKPAA